METEELKSFDLWAEGYAATGEHGTARHLGTYTAGSFREAVEEWNARKNRRGTWGKLTWGENGTPRIWGCRIFDNERAARKVFG